MSFLNLKFATNLLRSLAKFGFRTLANSQVDKAACVRDGGVSRHCSVAAISMIIFLRIASAKDS
jgi:hypothetical protein